jgi:hypothetical protein
MQVETGVHGTTQTYQQLDKFHGLPGLVMMLKDRENVLVLS